MIILMEWISPEYVEQLHKGGWNPYSQHLEKIGQEWHWIISIFDDEAYEQIYPNIIEKNEVYIRHDDIKIKIIEKETVSITTDELLETYYFQHMPRSIKIKFKTPTAFKQKGQYLFYPDLRCILQSMILKYDAVTVKEGTIQEEILEELVRNTRITQYNLRSCSFYMEGVKIPAFIGEIKLAISGPQTLVNYINFLFRFACYSGIGIKASVGMGAIEIQEKSL